MRFLPVSSPTDESIAPHEAVRGPEAERHGRHVDLAQYAGAQPGRCLGRALLQGEDGRTDLLDGDVQFVDGLADARPHLGHLRLPLRGLQHHPGCVQALDDQVVEVAGDPVAVLEHRDPFPVALRLGHHQGECRLRGELGGEGAFRLGEGAGADRAGCHEYAEHPAVAVQGQHHGRAVAGGQRGDQARVGAGVRHVDGLTRQQLGDHRAAGRDAGADGHVRGVGRDGDHLQSAFGRGQHDDAGRGVGEPAGVFGDDGEGVVGVVAVVAVNGGVRLPGVVVVVVLAVVVGTGGFFRVLGARAGEQGGRDGDRAVDPALALPGRLVQPRVADGQARLGGQHPHHVLVVVGEFGGVVLLAEIEIPEDLALDADGYAEERPHRRVVRRKSGRSRIGGEVREPEGFGVADEFAEQSGVAVRAAADPPGYLGVHAEGDEVREPAARLAHDAERGVAGADETGRRLADPVERGVQFETGTDGAHGFEQLRDAGGEFGGQALESPGVVGLRTVLGFGRCHNLDPS